MILTGPEIRKQVRRYNIVIDPFNDQYIGPNSYDVHLGDGLKQVSCNTMYDNVLDTIIQRPIDPQDNDTYFCEDVQKSKVDGWILYPDTLYLGSTVETATSHKYAPMFEGVSSLARLGISVHKTAGFGDIGWGFVNNGCTYPTWTLEIEVRFPTILRVGMKIGQCYFFKPKGKIQLYNGKYHNQHGPQESLAWRDK